MVNRINWARLAKPQDDQYDTGVIWHMATTRPSPLRPMPYKKRPVSIKDGPVIFDGCVQVRKMGIHGVKAGKYVDAPLDSPNIWLAVEYVRRWPAVFEQFKRLMDTFYPLKDVTARTGQRGSSSGANEAEFGSLNATVHDPIGLADSFVHEMAHQKLRALGISIEASYGLIINPPDDLFVSPIIKDRKRPMTAVFHATYSFTHVTCLEIHMVRSEWDSKVIPHLIKRLRTDVDRISEGLREIRKFIRVDKSGKSFLKGFYDWADSVVEDGENEISSFQKTRMVQSV